jgi:NADH dehydrogenase FAD-containing subunit
MTRRATHPGERPHVVVIGAGFDGLASVRGLRKAPVRVTWIDRKNYHLFQPLLYQVATAALSPADIAAPTRAVARNWRNVEAVLGEVTGVDVEARTVKTARQTYAYDYLVVAGGTRITGRTIIWGAGVKATPVASRLGTKAGKKGSSRCGRTSRCPAARKYSSSAMPPSSSTRKAGGGD